VGLDISKSALKLAERRKLEKKALNLSLILGDCFHLPFSDDSFEFVWSQGLHEHFDDYAEILREEYRVCKKGGYVYAGVPYYYSYATLWYMISRLPGCRKIWPWTDQVFFKIPDILKVCQTLAPTAVVSIMKPPILGILIVKIPK
jgi:ubiquinone/menaquinone biosynthesis C-methylase UbiE